MKFSLPWRFICMEVCGILLEVSRDSSLLFPKFFQTQFLHAEIALCQLLQDASRGRHVAAPEEKKWVNAKTGRGFAHSSSSLSQRAQNKAMTTNGLIFALWLHAWLQHLCQVFIPQFWLIFQNPLFVNPWWFFGYQDFFSSWESIITAIHYSTQRYYYRLMIHERSSECQHHHRCSFQFCDI